MSPAPATSVLERRGTIRNRARAGEDPKAIAADLRVGTRTVLGVLAMPETDYERDTADLLAGWSPDCMDATDWTNWQRMNPGNVGGGKALKPCWDCPLEFAVEMRAEDRCNGSPGRPVGRPVSRPLDLGPRPIDVARARETFVHRASIHAQITEPTEAAVEARIDEATAAAAVLYPAPPEEEPAVLDAPDKLTSTDDVQDPDEGLPTADDVLGILKDPGDPEPMDEALEQLASRAAIAASAWTTKLAAAEAAIAADDAWMVAQRALEDAWSAVGLGVSYREIGEREAALGDLIEAGERAIEAGVEDTPELEAAVAAAEEELGLQPVLDEAQASVALDGETQVSAVSEPPPIIPETIPEPEPARPTDPPPADLSRLTTHERRVLVSVVHHKGDRRAVAMELGFNNVQSVDQALANVGRKGCLPVELIPLLPARFAQYATVAER